MIESVTIETATSCNALCKICPNQFKPRPHYLMPLEEFETILQFFPNLKGVVLCGMYEPLTDSRLNTILDIIHAMHPEAAVTIFTNGALLTDNVAKMLLSHQNFKNLVVSIHGFSKQVYESMMRGLNRDEVYENVIHFMQLVGYNPEPQVSVSFVRIKQNIHELEAFRNFWKEKVDVVSDFEVMNWRGAVPIEELLYETPKHTRPCPMFEQPLVIDAFGRIVRCCYDFSESPYGHILKGGLKKWLSKRRISDTYPMEECRSCLGWKYYG